MKLIGDGLPRELSANVEIDKIAGGATTVIFAIQKGINANVISLTSFSFNSLYPLHESFNHEVLIINSLLIIILEFYL